MGFNHKMYRGLSKSLGELTFEQDSHTTRNALFTALFDLVTKVSIDENEQGQLQEVISTAVQKIGDFNVIERALKFFDKDADG